ncbi:MAG: hypothetical protein RLZZ591_371 [Pseudomonadota bacterium]|jgi:hypothetical protein
MRRGITKQLIFAPKRAYALSFNSKQGQIDTSPLVGMDPACEPQTIRI